ncbi:allose kinase [Anaerolentibacter hominis]|uniref:allose kinase n=1 Tax=Anaerolentibacter hominis TaxID=3079009 RepID=UPI0031B8AA3A
MKKGYFIGIDIGGTNLRIGLAGPDGRPFGLKKVSSRELLARRDVAEALEDFIRAYCMEQIPDGQILAIAMGIPGTLSRDGSHVLSCPNIHGFDNRDLGTELTRRLQAPVTLAKDVTMLLYHDRQVLHLPEEGIVIGIYYGTGIGNAIMLNGSVLTGKDGAAGELGHIPMYGRKEICNCGNPGCTENFASGWRLQQLKESLFPDTPMEELFVRHGESEALEDFVDAMGVTAAAEINLLNPDGIVLGGGILNMPGFSREKFERQLHQYVRKPFPDQSLELFYSESGDFNGVDGAILYARQRYNMQNIT